MLAKPVKPKCNHFYRYASNAHLNWLEPILLQNELYFPSPNELNDPTEGKPKPSKASEPSICQFLYDRYVDNKANLPQTEYDKIKQVIIDNVHSLGPEQVLKQMSESVNHYLNLNRIYSMSKRWNNMSMWAKYANNHTGYCLEFKNEGLFSKAYEVDYSNKEITVDFTDLNAVNGYFFFHKSSEWSNEEEVRIVTPSHIQPPTSFDPALLTRVILGYRISTEDKSQIIKWTEKRSIPLLVVQSRYNEFNHELELINIENKPSNK